ncbi:hypothetical protein GQ602_006843 [Ophiocordyceps camponoti-floridani]|uniref:Uncharacterized protein n=1 Tax=Ophiocordyceps camponoti-floridani TaxID=2030778 RepID=A0A8H4Q286_9HYPO|nr:hypothetical protein GQ602_006843 [Ophiocordyceps camponoti-floridani]
MNCTEGSLSRHSRRRGWKAEEARQKSHFARVRAARAPIPSPQETTETTSESTAPIRQPPSQPAPSSHPVPHAEPCTFEERKIRLLQRPDWAGLDKGQRVVEAPSPPWLQWSPPEREISDETRQPSWTGREERRRRKRLARLAAVGESGPNVMQPRPSRVHERATVLDADDEASMEEGMEMEMETEEQV